MGILSRIFGRNEESDDEKELRLYNKQRAKEERISDATGKAVFVVDDVFSIGGRGTVAVGTVTEGAFSVGDKVTIDSEQSTETVITDLEQFRKQCDIVYEGDNAGMLLKDITRSQIHKGDLIIKR